MSNLTASSYWLDHTYIDKSCFLITGLLLCLYFPIYFDYQPCVQTTVERHCQLHLRRQVERGHVEHHLGTVGVCSVYTLSTNNIYLSHYSIIQYCSYRGCFYKLGRYLVFPDNSSLSYLCTVGWIDSVE